MDLIDFCQKEPGRIYLDHNATAPLSRAVLDQVPHWLASFGNASSIHWTGRGPKALLRQARKQIADSIGAHPLEIVFTSGGTEANNLALRGVAESARFGPAATFQERNRIVISSVEHPAVFRTACQLRQWGFDVVVIPVHRDGRMDTDRARELITDRTLLVSTMFANNETGHIFPVDRLAQWARAQGALFHCDGVQALGKCPVNVRDLGVDLMAFSGHKFYALKGSGFLYVRGGVDFLPQITGGGQERHRRGGTENVLAQASLGLMCAQTHHLVPRAEHMSQLRQAMETGILGAIDGVRVIGAQEPRLPNTLSVVVDGVDGESLLMNLDIRGFSVSTGAACSSGNPEPSPVLLAMGWSRREAQSSLRVSLGWGTTADEIQKFVDVLIDVVKRLRNLKPMERETHVVTRSNYLQ
jgi:cysteine desulfurase